MKRVYILCLCLCIGAGAASCKKDDHPTASTTPVDTIPRIPGYTLVWNDEFSAPSVDAAKWNYEVNGDGGGNNELQYYTARPENSYIKDSCLVIRALRETYLGKAYTSARMTTRLKGDWKYGRVEARAKLPYGRGMWPAIWMMPTRSVYGGWPRSGEIDIMECLGHEPQKVYGTLHYASSTGSHLQQGGNLSLKEGTFVEKYHTFAVEWDSTGISWSMDGTKFFTATMGAPFDQQFYMILNVAVGGNWPGNPDEFTTFPQTMIVDYVRVYQRD